MLVYLFPLKPSTKTADLSCASSQCLGNEQNGAVLTNQKCPDTKILMKCVMIQFSESGGLTFLVKKVSVGSQPMTENLAIWKFQID